MNKSARQGRGVVIGLLITLVLPATALAKAPTVSTGSASAITQTTATVRGKVNPQGASGVVAFFQYGPNKLYGATTPETPLSAAKRAVSTSAALSNLTAHVKYHYRVVSRSGNSYVFGGDQTFTTQKQPLGLSLAADPAAVKSGGATTLTGNLSGTDNAGKQVLLQSQAFGTAGFTNTGNPQVVDASGNFSFPILNVFVNTAYKVVLPDKPEIVSPIVFVTVPLKVRLHAPRTVRRGHRITFKGTVSPSSAGSLVEIQKRFHGTYVTVGQTKVKSDGSHFNRSLKLAHGGRFRAQVTPGGAYVANTSGSHKVTVKRR